MLLKCYSEMLVLGSVIEFEKWFLGQGSIRYKVCYSLSESEYKRILMGICFVFFD